MQPRGHHRIPVMGLLIAASISKVGIRLSQIALPWFVLQTTGSAAQTGLTAFAVTLPALLSGIFGGTIVDRVGYKRSSVISDLVGAAGIGLIPTLYVTVGLHFWLLLVLVFISALLDIPGLSARRSMLPELAELGNIRLERVNSAFEGIQSLTMLVGPVFAGILIAFIGPGPVLWITAAAFLISALMVSLLVPAFDREQRPEETGGYVAQFMEGFRFLVQNRLLRALAAGLALSNLLMSPLVAVILPVYADHAFGDATRLGFLVTALGAGSLIGVVIYGAIGHRLPRRPIWITGFILISAPLWVLLTEPSFVLLAALLFTGAIAIGPINPMLVTIRHERIPAHLRGRVFSTFSAIAMGITPIGMILAGTGIEWLGFLPTVATLAVAALAVGLCMPFVPAFRHMEKPSTRASERFTVAPTSGST